MTKKRRSDSVSLQAKLQSNNYHCIYTTSASVFLNRKAPNVPT